MTVPTRHDLERKRGDTLPIQMIVKDGNGDVVDVTGASFRLVVDPSPSPVNSSANLFEVTGAITDAAGGEVSFTLSGAQANQSPGNYSYDIEMVDASSIVITLASGYFRFVQDIAK